MWMRHSRLWDVIFLQRLEVVDHIHTVNSAAAEVVKQAGGKVFPSRKNPTVLTKVSAFDLSVTPLLHQRPQLAFPH